MYVIWHCKKCGQVDANIAPEKLSELVCPLCKLPREGKQMEVLSNNVFFPEDFGKENIQRITRKNIDIIPAIKDIEQPNPIPGLAIVSVDDDEIRDIIGSIQASLDYFISGEGDIRLGNTTIVLPAVIIGKI